MEKLWSLKNENGWVICASDDGREMIPVWPHQFYAKQCACGEWLGCTPQNISLAVWVNKWIPGMLRDKRLVAVFPIPPLRRIILMPDRLAADINEELKKY
jgi:hypothetical protein